MATDGTVRGIFNIYTVITPTLGVLRGELSFPQEKQVEQWPKP